MKLSEKIEKLLEGKGIEAQLMKDFKVNPRGIKKDQLEDDEKEPLKNLLNKGYVHFDFKDKAYKLTQKGEDALDKYVK